MSKNSFKTYNRYFVAILYEEDANFEKYFQAINERYQEVTYIVHDKDTTEDGELKKKHIHILFKVGKNARRIKSIAEETEIPCNYLEGCNKNNMLLYMIHYKNKNKYQYNVEEVQGELKEELKQLLVEKKTDKQILNEILSAMRKKEIATYRELVQFSIENNYTEVLKKYSYILCKCL